MRTEFEFIRNIKKKYWLNRLGDDCAVLSKDPDFDLVVTADMLVEDIDFRREATMPALLGHKALAVSLSDIAAMGGTPKWAMLSIAVPRKIWESKFVDKFYEGWFALAREHGVELIGGDISRSPNKIVIDSVVAGHVSKGRAIRRSSAAVGDSIFVTNHLGGAAGGLFLLESGMAYTSSRGSRKKLIERQLIPIPRVEIGKRVASHATAMIDISDGLSADLHHICEASNVGARIDLELIPIDPNLKVFSPDKRLEFALGGGEDFELLFTSKQKKLSSTKTASITCIGEVTSNTGIVELVERDHARVLPPKGYRHF